ncbi:hypothetical protein BKA93DRAFT_725900 [Sparassis latifolia]|uniref:Uncharacterized protein n=1 Tax=Sparassis crispa TaxID=139825 RepID=A0A401GLD0_9APHY|nr:hypothetical protein SCP_0500210 [Sparassis crispa]GBE82978.1 hypothetical protein SCP_0500210 [Sparassis crispa]
MSSVSTPQSSSGYASPAPLSAPPPVVPVAQKPHSKAKPANVFSNDGSFLERFQHIKKDEEEKKKQEEMLAQKRGFDERFKKRGKRPLPDTASSTPTTETSAKKPKVDKPMTQYQKEVRNYAGRSLKDNGIGVRPLVK